MPATNIQKTARFIPVSVVREDPFAAPFDSPEVVLPYWHDVIAAQPDYEPDKETLAVVIVNTRLRPFAWHRVSVGTVAISHLNVTVGASQSLQVRVPDVKLCDEPLLDLSQTAKLRGAQHVGFSICGRSCRPSPWPLFKNSDNYL